MPLAPKRTVFAFTVVASNPFTLKIATLILPLLLGLILLASLRGLYKMTLHEKSAGSIY
jgi:hypothetical protein